MRLEFKPQAFEDLQYWVQHNPKMAKRLLRLIEETYQKMSAQAVIAIP